MGDRVYVGSCAGSYYALDLATGGVVWEHDFTAESEHATFHGDAALTPDLLITGTEAMDTLEARALRLDTGDVVWTQLEDLAFTRTSVRTVGELAVGRNDLGDVLFLHASTGTPRAVVPGGSEVYRADMVEAPVVVDEHIVFSRLDGAIVAVDVRGDERWSVDVGCDVTTSIGVAGADLYVGCADGWLYHIVDAEVVEAVDTRTVPEGELVVTDDRVVVPGGRTWIGAFHRRLGEPVWERTDLDTLTVVNPLHWDDAVVTGGRDSIYALAINDGATVWSFDIDGNARGLGRAGSVLLVGTIEGVLYAIDVAKLE